LFAINNKSENVLKLLLPMNLVRNRIRNVLLRETGKTTFRRIKYNVGLGAKEFRFVQYIGTVCRCSLQGYRY